MNHRRIILMTIITFLFCTSIVAAEPTKYKIQFHNTSNETAVYYLYQIDHKIKHISKPIAFVIGSLKPGQDWSVLRDAGGHYYVEWKSEEDEVLMKLEPFYLNKDLSYTYTSLK